MAPSLEEIKEAMNQSLEESTQKKLEEESDGEQGESEQEEQIDTVKKTKKSKKVVDISEDEYSDVMSGVWSDLDD